MLKKITLLPLMTGLLLSHTVWSTEKDINSFGDHEVSNLQISKLTHSGSIEVLNSAIEAFSIINGQLKSKNTSFCELTVNGDAELEQSKIEGKVAINGSLDADSSSFGGPVLIHGHISAESCEFNDQITLHGNQAEFEESSLKTLVIQENHSNTPQTIYLEDSIVANDIVFKQGNGTVVLDNDSQVKGEVKGGIIKNA
tara:strand:+ start:61664 stop:62257 length:594 start_codon:yes stop_codon:yes gene_type:complete